MAIKVDMGIAIQSVCCVSSFLDRVNVVKETDYMPSEQVSLLLHLTMIRLCFLHSALLHSKQVMNLHA